MTTFEINGFQANVLELPQCGSTNDAAFDALQDAPLAAVWTTHQEQGRGSRGRLWQTPRGCGLAFSLGLGHGSAPPPNAFLYPLFAGVIWHQTLSLLGMDSDLTLKWPNDVLWQGRKLSGILCESRWRSSHVHTVLGIGTNLHPHPALRELPYPVACLSESQVEVKPATLVEAALEQFRTGFEKYSQAPALLEAWMERAWIKPGQAVWVKAEGSELEGRFHGISSEGALCIKTQSGSVHSVSPTCTDFRVKPFPAAP